MIEIHESTGAYAVDALEPPELAEFEAHLATCQICSREVCEFCETTAELTLMTETTPPPTLRDNILCTIRNSPWPAVEDGGRAVGQAADQTLTGVFPDNQVSERGSGSKLFLRGDIAHADFLAVNIEPVGATPAAPTTDVLGAGEI